MIGRKSGVKWQIIEERGFIIVGFEEVCDVLVILDLAEDGNIGGGFFEVFETFFSMYEVFIERIGLTWFDIEFDGFGGEAVGGNDSGIVSRL